MYLRVSNKFNVIIVIAVILEIVISSTAVLSNLFDPAGPKDIIMKPRAAPVNSKVKTALPYMEVRVAI